MYFHHSIYILLCNMEWIHLRATGARLGVRFVVGRHQPRLLVYVENVHTRYVGSRLYFKSGTLLPGGRMQLAINICIRNRRFRFQVP